jgi:hypothetical protein
VPGGGLSKDRTTWRPSRANFFVPAKAFSPIYRRDPKTLPISPADAHTAMPPHGLRRTTRTLP